mmetsp:Transcript_12485/g.15172  ORF Transcript_12485/g.15172 Transcript_12485/m.15172 type:complete len:117 (+) Transcript_12485:88-438(+)
MINFILLISRQGKTRLKKWFVPCPERDQFRTIKEVSSLILNRSPKVCNFLEWRDYKLCYKRYASLFFKGILHHARLHLFGSSVIPFSWPARSLASWHPALRCDEAQLFCWTPVAHR